MLCMGIDQSFTSSGVVVKDTDSVLYHTVIRSDKEQDTITRAEFIADRIKMICENLQPDKIVIEGVAFMATGNVTRDLGGLQFIIISRLRKAIESHRIHIVAPTSLKKLATGTGRATKSDMYDALPKATKDEITVFYKKTKGRFDVVDAYWLATYGIMKNLGDTNDT